MIIYNKEKEDGIAEKIQASASICYASYVEPIDGPAEKKALKSLASMDDKDLYYVQSILVSSCWNKNDDIFDKNEIWKARNTPEHKPTNLEHDENIIIGHITSNWPITEDGVLIDKDTPPENLPEKYHIVTGSVVYTAYSSPDLQERTQKLISEIEQGTKYVSMECFFNGFDYGLINKNNGEFKVLPRNETTAHLTKHLRAYGGMGEHENYKIGRVLRQITFSGKGFVDKPANPDSIIFNKNLLDSKSELFIAEKNDTFENSGVCKNQPFTQIAENINMNEENKDLGAINSAPEAVSASENTKDQHDDTIAQETSIVEKNSSAEELSAIKADYEARLAKVESELSESADLVEKLKAETLEKDALISELQSKENNLLASSKELEEIIAGYKTKEEEMKKHEKMMKRKAFLLDAGIEESVADKALSDFENLDDDIFANMTSLLTSVADRKKPEEVDDDVTEEIKTVSEEVADVSVLETAEPSETTDIAVGGDNSEDEAFSARAALIDFVSNRLNQKQ